MDAAQVRQCRRKIGEFLRRHAEQFRRPNQRRSRAANVALEGEHRRVDPPGERQTYARSAASPSRTAPRSTRHITDEEMKDLARRDAVGDISLRFFDRNGVPVHGPLDDRGIGVTLEELRQTPGVVDVAGG